MNSRIVWARDENAEWTEDVLSHYAPGRTVWALEPDAEPVTLKPYQPMHTSDLKQDPGDASGH